MLLLLLGAFTLAPMQNAVAQAEPPLRSELPFGVGFQSSLPAFGVSGMYDVTDAVSGQAVLGFFGQLQMYTGRVLYRFNQQEAYDLFGFGSAGVWRYGSATSATGVGGGGGVEFNWARLLDSDSFPPIFSNLEFGFIYLTDDVTNFSSLSYGGGIHYRF